MSTESGQPQGDGGRKSSFLPFPPMNRAAARFPGVGPPKPNSLSPDLPDLNGILYRLDGPRVRVAELCPSEVDHIEVDIDDLFLYNERNIILVIIGRSYQTCNPYCTFQVRKCGSMPIGPDSACENPIQIPDLSRGESR